MRRAGGIEIVAVCMLLGLALLGAPEARGQVTREVRVVYDEAKQGDFEAVEPAGEPAVRVDEPGVYEVRGTGVDNVDDADAFVFEVGGEKLFGFRLLAEAAEFKKLRAIDAGGKVREIAFGSTNGRFKAPRNITAMGLEPGRYHVEMYFGPSGALGGLEGGDGGRAG